MVALIADRFVVDVNRAPLSVARSFGLSALDLATGDRVTLRIGSAGSRSTQQAWVESCMRKYEDGVLLDFGFIGTERRFEATSPLRSRNGASLRAVSNVLEWLQNQKPSSFGILRVPTLPAARELRLYGFVPCRASLFGEPALSKVWRLLEGQSVVLLDSGPARVNLALGFMSVRRCNARETVAISVDKPDFHRAANAAEGRPTYGPRRVVDSRAGALLADVERLVAAGRHAGAERMLRSSVGAFDRRGDGFSAGEAEMVLGQLFSSRGRITEAARVFEQAHDRFQQVRAAVSAVNAMTQLGVAQTDLGLLRDAERSCRAARSAAAALKIPHLLAAADIALARNLIWLEQYSEARSIVERLRPDGDIELTARYWCLVARLHLAGNNVMGAGQAVARARPASDRPTPSIESLVRRWEAAVQDRVGDIEALERHVQAGLTAARAARLPLRSLKLRLTLIEGLLNNGRTSGARAHASHLSGISRRTLPPLLKRRAERTLALLQKPLSRANEPQPNGARETVEDFHVAVR